MEVLAVFDFCKNIVVGPLWFLLFVDRLLCLIVLFTDRIGFELIVVPLALFFRWIRCYRIVGLLFCRCFLFVGIIGKTLFSSFDLPVLGLSFVIFAF